MSQELNFRVALRRIIKRGGDVSIYFPQVSPPSSLGHGRWTRRSLTCCVCVLVEFSVFLADGS